MFTTNNIMRNAKALLYSAEVSESDIVYFSLLDRMYRNDNISMYWVELADDLSVSLREYVKLFTVISNVLGSEYAYKIIDSCYSVYPYEVLPIAECMMYGATKKQILTLIDMGWMQDGKDGCFKSHIDECNSKYDGDMEKYMYYHTQDGKLIHD